MALPVPSRYVPILNSVRMLSPSASEELIRALNSAEVTAEPQEMSDAITGSVPSITKGELDKLVDLLFSLYHVKEFSELNKNSFVSELLETVRDRSEPKISDEEFPAIRQRFNDLMSIKALESLSKTVALQREEERLYCDAKIISDIRPVFGDDVKQKPVSAAITHTLKIGYHENEEHKEFFIVLDGVDLDGLEKVIKRAKDKAETLTQVLSDSRIPRLGI